MKTTTKKTKTMSRRSILKIRSGVKAGGLISSNHHRSILKVRSGVKAGGLISTNHNRSVR